MQPIAWADVEEGQPVYIDNYQDGKFPKADPKISGPYTVKDRKRRMLTLHRENKPDSTFMHYPEELVVPTPVPDKTGCFSLTYDGERLLMSFVHDPEWVYKAQLMPDKTWVIADPRGQHAETIYPDQRDYLPNIALDVPRLGAAIECIIDMLNNRRGK